MLFKQILIRAFKMIISFIAYVCFVLGGASLILSNLPIRSLSNNLDISPNTVMSLGFAVGIVLASSLLGVLMIKLKLKVIDAMVFAVLLAMHQLLITSDSLTTNEYIEIALLLVIPPIIVFLILKKYKKNINVTS